MLTVPRYYASQHKPPVGSQLNRGHPLAQGMKVCCLFNEGHNYDTSKAGVTPENLAGPRASNGGSVPLTLAIQSSRTTISIPCYQPQSGSGFLDFGPSPTVGIPAFSIYIRGQYHNGGSFPIIFLNSNNTGAIHQNGFFADTTTSKWGFAANTTNNASVSVEATPSATTLDDVVGVYDGVNVIIYINGFQAASSPATGNTLTTATNLIMVGDQSGSVNSTCNIGFCHAMLWNRALSPGEVFSLWQDPYQMIYSPTRNGWLTVASTVTMRRSLSAYGARAGTRQLHRG